MGEVTRLEGVLFTTDAQVLSVMNQVLDNFEIDREVCLESASVLNAVTTMKFDTLIMDWIGTYESTRILNAMRNSEQNAKSTVLALVRGDREMQAATQAGANFIVYKPMNVDQATRCEVDIPVVANILGAGPVKGRIINVSVRGLAFLCDDDVKVDQQLAIALTLPGSAALIHVTGKVANVIKLEGITRVGVNFTSMLPNHLEVLEQWITDHLPPLPKRLTDSESNKNAN